MVFTIATWPENTRTARPDQGGADPYGSAGLTAPHRRAIFREIRFSFFWVVDLSSVRKAVNAESCGSIPMNISPTPTAAR